jgi:hypothetical protein
MKITYLEGSILGRMLDPSFNIRFDVNFDGVKEKSTSGRGMIHPMFENPVDPSNVGGVRMSIELPNGRHPTCEMRLSVSVQTQTQGVQDLRKPTKSEISALRKHWDTIRAAALEDARPYCDRDNPFSEVVAAFDRVAPLVTQTNIKAFIPNPQYHPNTIALTLAQNNAAIAVNPIVTPTAKQSAPKDAFQTKLQEAITDAEGELDCIGNGYGWTVRTVLSHLQEALKEKIPDLDLDDYTFGGEND